MNLPTNRIELSAKWLDEIECKWVGKDGLVIVLKDNKELALKLLFNSSLFVPELVQHIQEHLAENLEICQGSLASRSGDAKILSAGVEKRIAVQVAMHQFLKTGRIRGLSAVEILGGVIADDNIVGYFMPRIHYPAMNINSNEMLKMLVILFETKSGITVDKLGRNAFEAGYGEYILIDAEP
jgi:hypothetical protein